MTKPITIKGHATAWAAVNAAGEVWHIDMCHRTKKDFIEFYFAGQYEMNFKPRGWKIVLVTVTPSKGKR